MKSRRRIAAPKAGTTPTIAQREWDYSRVLRPQEWGPIAQAFGIIASKDDLYGAEKPLVELRLLVGEQLPDAIADRGAAAFKFYDCHCDAVDIKDQVGPASIAAA